MKVSHHRSIFYAILLGAIFVQYPVFATTKASDIELMHRSQRLQVCEGNDCDKKAENLFDSENDKDISLDKEGLEKDTTFIETVNGNVNEMNESIIGESLFLRLPNTDPSSLRSEIDPDCYILGPGDMIRVNLWKQGQPNNDFEVEVLPEGRLIVPFIDEFDTKYRSLSDLSKQIYEKASKKYPDFHISVSLSKLKSFKVTVIGAVKYPGSYRVSSVNTVSDAIALAGGIQKSGSIRKVQLNRRDEKAEIVDLFEFFNSGRIEKNPYLTVGDVIEVQNRYGTVAISGEVNRPGRYELLADETIDNLIDFSAGFTAKADLTRLEYRSFHNLPGHLAVHEMEKIDYVEDYESFRNHYLQDLDEIIVYDSYLRSRANFTILGAVVNPGTYSLANGIRISDAIYIAGGLTEKAFLKTVSVEHFDYQRQEYIQKDFSLDQVMQNDEFSNILIERGDIIQVFSIDEKGDFVTVIGQVLYPGTYPLLKGYTINDILTVAGGPILDYNPGASPVKIPADLDRTFIRRFDDHLNFVDIEINLRKLWIDKDINADKNLINGDTIFVPAAPYYIAITGMVAGPAYVPYQPKQNANYYISRINVYSGADIKRAKVIRGSDTLSGQDIEIYPGDEIYIPQRRIDKLSNAMGLIRDWYGFYIFIDTITK